MAFFKVSEVTNEFYKVFLTGTTQKSIPGDSLNTHPMLPIMLNDTDAQDFLVRYYKRSGESPAEDTKEFYPCIVIQDFAPEIDRTRMYGKDWVEGAINTLAKTREYIVLPIPLIYRFQVSLVTKRNREVQAGMDWFLGKFDFQRPSWFMMNEYVTADNGSVGDVVPYSCMINDVPRDDGRFEYCFDYTLKPVVHSKKVTNKDYIDQIIVHLSANSTAKLVDYIATTIEFELDAA